MKTFIEILKRLVSKLKASTGLSKQNKKQMQVVHRGHAQLYRSSVKLVRSKAIGENLPLHAKELKMLSRRLKQFRHVQWSGSRLQQEEAARRLQKLWKQILRKKMRVVRSRKVTVAVANGSTATATATNKNGRCRIVKRSSRFRVSCSLKS